MTCHDLARQVVEALNSRGRKITTVESCTGGLIAAAITRIAGSSAVFDYGFVTYANAAKTAMVGVPEDLFPKVGAVSQEVALAMAEGGLIRSGADIALSVTGVAGPGGGTEDKPVGTVWFGRAVRGADGINVEARLENFGDIGRDQVREKTVECALTWAMEAVEGL